MIVGMKVLVVGASGFVGQHIADQLRRRDHAVTAVARSRREGIDHALDATTASVADVRVLLAGHDAIVFAAGVDDREVRRAPAYPAFQRGNVEPVVRLLTAAREEGLTRAVIVGSYYTHFHRRHPDWQLAATHPYIRSRVEQARAGREAAGPHLPVAMLELPFVFGRAADRIPNWAGPLGSWVRSRSPLFAPVGGTAATAVVSVGEAAVAALESASGEDVPVVDENITWHDMISRVAVAAGRPQPVRRLPSTVVRGALRLTGLTHTMTRKQSGLDPRGLADLLLRELFIERGTPRSIDAAIAETFWPMVQRVQR
jgi:dihydroflavonol-4-reductase